MFGSLIGKALMGMLMRMITTKAVEDITIYALEQLVKMSKSTADDELLSIVKKHLGK